MKILAIIGTNRRNGLVERLCKKVIDGASENGHECELINLFDFKIGNCIGCWKCVKNNECVLNDDFDKILEKFKEAKVIILGIPCYWSNVPGIVKTFFDRHTGPAMFKPVDGANFVNLKTTVKIKKIINALKNFGALPMYSQKRFWLISAMTYPFPKALISGDYKGLINAVKHYAHKLKCKSFNYLVFTDSLFRFIKNKEERYLRKAYIIGQNIK